MANGESYGQTKSDSQESFSISGMEILSLPEFVSQCIEKDNNLPDYMKPPDSMNREDEETVMKEEKL